jgi:hypothetical protein
MGEIIFWTIVRITILLPIIWFLQGYFHTEFWWIISVLAIYGIVIHPAVIHYRLFKSKNKEVLESTLCSTCAHFDKSAILCMLHDKHPSKDYLPCEGFDWEPKPTGADRRDIYSE